MMDGLQAMIEQARTDHARRMITFRRMERIALDKILRDMGPIDELPIAPESASHDEADRMCETDR